MKREIPVIGYAPLLDEADYLEGWVKNIRVFCDEVYALYDPRSQDNSLEILERFVEEYKDTDCPVHIWEQDPNLGDSYRGKMGPKKELSYRHNVNKFIQEVIPMDAWSMWLAGDERLNPHEIDEYEEILIYADFVGFTGVVFKLYDCFPDINHYANYDLIYGKDGLRHRKLVKRTPYYKYNLTPHSGYMGGQIWICSDLQFFHFGHLKGDVYLNWWRHGNGLDMLEPISPEQRYIKFENPFKDWKRGILKNEPEHKP